MTDLLTWNQAKFQKAMGFGYFNAGHHLAPAKLSGHNVCPDSSPECRALCLNQAGQGEAYLLRADGSQQVQQARVKRTHMFQADKVAYVDRLKHEVGLMVRRAKREGMTLCMRLNATSDLPWERLKGTDGKTVLEAYPSIQFYDYTKSQKRALAFMNGDLPANYFLTFSRDERPKSEAFALTYLALGGRVALCLRIPKKQAIPATWHGFPCKDGDLHDLRFLDPEATVTVLRPKGSKALKAVESGFVIRPENWVN